MKKKNKKLRSGFTTGACAAAAAKAATVLLVTGRAPEVVEIPFPEGQRIKFMIVACELTGAGRKRARAAVIKDAGDDPDVTNGARIEAEVFFAAPVSPGCEMCELSGGAGVGTVTKKGLAVPVGEPAINPVPRQMIRAGVAEVFSENGLEQKSVVHVIISVPDGEILAEKTLNYRLGIVGGLSILGTTGIVRPVSAEAWTATISASLDVAASAGLNEIILSTGRTSERAVHTLLHLPDEAQVMMGDYLHYALEDSGRHGFKKIHLAAMWAKVMKAAMKVPQTHVRNGALEVESALEFLGELGADHRVVSKLEGSNTAREIFSRLQDMERLDLVMKVCEAAHGYATEVSGADVIVYLVDSSGCVVLSTAGDGSRG